MQVSSAECMREREDLFSAAEYALGVAERLSPEYAEAFIEDSYANSYALEQGRLNGSSYVREKGIRIRIIKGKRLYTFSSNDLSEAAIKRLLSRPANFKGVNTEMSEERIAKDDFKCSEKGSIDGLDMLKELLIMDKALSRQKYVKFRNIYGGAGRTIDYFINSEGSHIRQEVPGTMVFASIIVGNGKETRQRMLNYGTVGGIAEFEKLGLAEQFTAEAKKSLNVIEKGVSLPKEELAGIREVIISPEICGIAAHESVGHPNEADRLFGREAAQAGTSYLTKDTLGMAIGSREVTLVDKPDIKGANGFMLYDEEGVKGKEKIIIKNGRQNELLANREYAKVLGRKSNGSARSDSFSNEPLVRMSNTYLEPGRYSLDDLEAEVKNGVRMESFTEWNIDDTRSFSRYQANEAYIIKNGSADRPVKNFILESKTLDFWKAVRMRTKDFRLYAGSCGKGEPMQGVDVTMGGPYALLKFGGE